MSETPNVAPPRKLCSLGLVGLATSTSSFSSREVLGRPEGLRSRFVGRVASVLAATAWLGSSACGYRPVHGEASSERFSVVLVSSNLPDAVAADEVVAGVRDELARAGALMSGDVYPRCEVEVLRVDEGAEGIVATTNTEGVLLPESRATRIGIVARAWIVRSNGGARERDTGDVRALEVAAVAPDARSATFHHLDTARAAGRRAGRRIGARILGLPTSSD